ncbi:MAG: PH domain-containing protein [Nanoarchaeota archaeon]
MRERGVLSIRNSRKLYIPVYLMIFILFLAIGMIKFYGKEINDWAFRTVLVFSAVGMIMTEFHRLRNRYEINDSSFVHVKGVLVKTTTRTDLSVISDIVIKQNPWQIILGYGTVHVVVYSEETPIKNVDNPLMVVSFLENKMKMKRVVEHSKQRRGNK